MHSEHVHVVNYNEVILVPYFQMVTRSGICLLKASDQYICCGDVGGQVRTSVLFVCVYVCVCVCVCVGGCVYYLLCGVHCSWL